MPEPISLDEAKLQLRAQSSTTEDGLIEELIVSARQHVEKYSGLVLIAASATMPVASFAELERMPMAPVREITEVRYLDANGVEQVLDPAVYELVQVDGDELRPRLRLAFGKSWPATRSAEDAVRVVADVGYTAVPSPIIRAMKILITHWFDNRQLMAAAGDGAEIPHAASALLTNYRR